MASEFKFGMQLGFTKARHKNHTQKKGWAWPWARGASQNLGSPSIFTQWLKLVTSNLVHSFGSP